MKNPIDKIVIAGQITAQIKLCRQILEREGYQVECITTVDQSVFKKKRR